MAHSKKLIRIICITSEYILESEIVKEAPVSELWAEREVLSELKKISKWPKPAKIAKTRQISGSISNNEKNYLSQIILHGDLWPWNASQVKPSCWYLEKAYFWNTLSRNEEFVYIFAYNCRLL